VILVDSSVLIKALGHQTDSPKVRLLDRALAQEIPVAICPYVYQEVLQGVADEVTYARVRRYLDTQECLWLPSELATFEQAAHLYWNLRRQGVTIRSTIDVLIALTAMRHHALLLHDDRDFDQMAAHLPELTILSALPG
jgi:predicted nucleic acid-binding protein